MIVVDSCVLLDVATEDPQWSGWSARQLAHFGATDELVISPVIYAEVGLRHEHRSKLDASLAGYRWDDLDREVAWRAARAHAAYRQRGGKRERVLGDFWIGAHAEARGWKLLTRNPGDFKDFRLGNALICPGHRDAPQVKS